MTAPSAGSAVRRCWTAFFGSKPNSATALIEACKEGAGADRCSALDLEDPPLGADTAICRGAAHLAVGSEHAMARHDDGDGVLAHRLADLARFVRLAEAPGDLAVGHRVARRDGARDRVGALVEIRRFAEVERHVAEVHLLAGKQFQHALD